MIAMMKRYVEDDEMFMLSVMAVTGVLSSQPGLIGAAKRLIAGDLCELLTVSMRTKCQQKQCSQSRLWTHFSFPYTCRVCVVHCTAAYCCLVSDPDCFQDAYERFHRMEFHGMLKCAPAYHNDALTLEAAVVLPGHSASALRLEDSTKESPTNRARSQNDSALVRFHDPDDSSDDETQLTVPLPPEVQARQRLITAGVFHNAQQIPEEVRNTDSLRESEVSEGDYRGAIRNIEFVAYMTRTEKDYIMHMLFKLFNVE